VHPGMDIVRVSCTTGDGLQEWLNWIERRRVGKPALVP
jgi:Ni2+-binding GTPase involved in maturation of urease and hydrogenase